MRLIQLLLSSLLWLQAPLAFSANTAEAPSYPSRAVTIIVPFAAGSGTDINARRLADALAKRTGQAVVVDNRPGANGQIAAKAAATAQPDGHTVFLTTNTTHGANSALLKTLNYDPIQDFEPVSTVGASGMLLVVNADSPYQDAHALFDAMRAGGEKTWHYGIGNSSSHVQGALLGLRLQASATGVPYRSSMPAVTDLIGGTLDYMFIDVGAAHSFVQSGRLRPLASSGAQREPLLPQVPTLDELGLQDMEMTVWSAAFVPANTPQPVVQRLSELIRAILLEPAMQDAFTQTGGRALGSTPEALATFVAQEIEKWGKAVQTAGIEPE